MAPRKWHLVWGFLSYILFLVMYVLIYMNQETLDSIINLNWNKLPQLNLLIIGSSFVMALLGSEIADFDLILGWLSHRDILTHSFFIPVFITITVIGQQFISPGDPSIILSLIFIPFLFGFASHLFLDLFPNLDPEKEIKEKSISKTAVMLLGGAIQGLTGTELIKAMKGTYLIHLPFRMKITDVALRDRKDKYIENRKTFPLHTTRWWLFLNGLITVFLGLSILLAYIWI